MSAWAVFLVTLSSCFIGCLILWAGGVLRRRKKGTIGISWCGCPDDWNGIGRAIAHERLRVVNEKGEMVGVKYVCHASGQMKTVIYEAITGEAREVADLDPYRVERAK